MRLLDGIDTRSCPHQRVYNLYILYHLQGRHYSGSFVFGIERTEDVSEIFTRNNTKSEFENLRRLEAQAEEQRTRLSLTYSYRDSTPRIWTTVLHFIFSRRSATRAQASRWASGWPTDRTCSWINVRSRVVSHAERSIPIVGVVRWKDEGMGV